MHKPYRNSAFLPRIFFAFALLFAVGARAETVEILPQFNAFEEPRDMSGLMFQDAKGNEHSISEYRGHLVLLNLWATWCVPCRLEMAGLDRLQEVYKDTKLKILPISIDTGQTEAKVFDFFHENAIKNLPILLDANLRIAKELHPVGLPTSYLIGPDGKAVGKIEGFAQWDSPEAGNLIESYLQKDSKQKSSIAGQD